MALRTDISTRYVAISGVAEIRAQLAQLNERLAVNVARRGLRAGAAVIRDTAKPLTPARKKKDGTPEAKSGGLRDSILAESRGIFRDGLGRPIEHRAVTIISKKKGPRNRSPRAYAKFVEGGTRPHFIGKGAVNRRFSRSKRKLTFAGRKHPGARKQPFIGLAFMLSRQEALRTIFEVMRREAAREIRKLEKARTRAAGGRRTA